MYRLVGRQSKTNTVTREKGTERDGQKEIETEGYRPAEGWWCGRRCRGSKREREIETKIFIHTSAQQPHGFDFVSCPVQLLDRPGPVLMEILGQRRSDR